MVNHDEVMLVYVTGRDEHLVKEAIEEYQLPLPNYVIADVGSSIYKIENDLWQTETPWQVAIGKDWQQYSHADLQQFLVDFDDLNLQEQNKQNSLKLSYYVPLDCEYQKLMNEMQAVLIQHRIQAALIWSIDDLTQVGLLDVLPASAGKYQAVNYLMRRLRANHNDTIFVGDSGNDLSILCSPIQSVLVANATHTVRELALEQSCKNGYCDSLYIARGGYLNMNGNYSAGIIEGVVHYIPRAASWLTA